MAMANGKEFLRLQVKKTCEHLFLRPLLGAMLNITADCVVLKVWYFFMTLGSNTIQITLCYVAITVMGGCKSRVTNALPSAMKE